ncbi:hypothetical protein HYV88_06080 [Candidatus Woesearchaeota archaeon]|nr:hypothetical protein [Candidatus Woesearchaeota archaeon]
MKETLASLLIGLSSVLGNTEVPSSMPSSRENLITTRPSLEETIFDIPGVVKKDIDVREAKIGIKMPEIPLINLGEVELFTEDDYVRAIKEMNGNGGNFYFDRKRKKVFILDKVGKRIRESDGRVLSVISENGRKIYALYDIARRERIESVLPLDIRGNTGLVDNRFLFNLNNRSIIYKADDKVVGFNRKFVVVENKKGYFLVDVGLGVSKKVWEKDEREEIYVSDNGRYCLGILKEEDRFIDICDVLKNERRYRFIGGLGIEGISNKGVVRLGNGQAIEFRDMNEY